jgi:hypothetical protein
MINQKHLADVITVPETELVDAMAHLWRYYRIIVEPSGAVALAGLLHAAHRLPHGRIGVITSGGNVDWDTCQRPRSSRHADRSSGSAPGPHASTPCRFRTGPPRPAIEFHAIAASPFEDRPRLVTAERQDHLATPLLSVYAAACIMVMNSP